MVQNRRSLGSSSRTMVVPLLSTVLLLLSSSLSTVQAYDWLYAVAKSPVTNGMHLYRVDRAGFGTAQNLGQIFIANANSYTAFDVTGMAFDYKGPRPNGDLYILTGKNSGPVSNKVIVIDNPFGLTVPANPNAPIISAQLYADADEYSVGLAISDSQKLYTWRIGGNENIPEDDLVELVPQSGGLFPTPRQVNLNSGIATTGALIGYDVIRDKNNDQILHLIYYENATSKHRYFRYNLRTTESEWVSDNVVLNERNDRCYLGSMNPNTEGEFWCIRKQIDQTSQQQLVRINLNADPPVEVGGRTLTFDGVAAIAFSYSTTQAPSSKPSARPSRRPSSRPSRKPSGAPSRKPSRRPSAKPSRMPSRRPSSRPSRIPSELPSARPSRKPSRRPSGSPTEKPSGLKSAIPSEKPSAKPSRTPSRRPSGSPTEKPSRRPSNRPSKLKSAAPSRSQQPSEKPSRIPSEKPSRMPSRRPSVRPSRDPTSRPSKSPSKVPSKSPSKAPSKRPSARPSGKPSKRPSARPSGAPLSKCINNGCPYLGFLPGAQVNTNVFGICINRCVPDFLEGVYTVLGWSCGTC